MAKQFECMYANNLLEKLTTACAKGQPIFSLPHEEFKNVSVEDIGAILSMTNIYAVTKDTSKLRKLIVKKDKPVAKPSTKPSPKPVVKPVAPKIEPKLEPKLMSNPNIKHNSKSKKNAPSDMPILIPCTLEEELYNIEQIALIEISKLGKYPKVFIDLDDD